MSRRLIPRARRNRADAGRSLLKSFKWYSRGEKERLLVIDELRSMFGIANPNSYLHSEHDPDASDARLSATLLALPLDFARNILDYAKTLSQGDRDILQAVLRYIRHGHSRGVLTDSEVRRVELYLTGIPVFTALTSGDPLEIGSVMLNHAEGTNWIAHTDQRAINYPNGYFLYTTLWSKSVLPNYATLRWLGEYAKTMLPDYETLRWLDEHALELARFRSVLEQRGAFDREFCELLLASSAPVISSGVL